MKRLRVDDEITDYRIREETNDSLSDDGTLVLYKPQMVADTNKYPPRWFGNGARGMFIEALRKIDPKWYEKFCFGDCFIAAKDAQFHDVLVVPQALVKRGSMTAAEYNHFLQTEIRYKLQPQKARSESESSSSSTEESDTTSEDDKSSSVPPSPGDESSVSGSSSPEKEKEENKKK